MKTARALAALLGWPAGGGTLLAAIAHETYWLAGLTFALLVVHAAAEIVAFEVDKRRARARYEAAEQAATRHLVGDTAPRYARVYRATYYTEIARRSA